MRVRSYAPVAAMLLVAVLPLLGLLVPQRHITPGFAGGECLGPACLTLPDATRGVGFVELSVSEYPTPAP
jgi:hypothetical protein